MFRKSLIYNQDQWLNQFAEPVYPNVDHRQASAALTGRRILVTGAGGSIGSALVSSLLEFRPARLTLLDISENNLFELHRRLEEPERTEVEFVLGNVGDRRLLDSLFGVRGFDLTFHTAALKHVPLLESQPLAAVENNIFGTYELAGKVKRSGRGKLIMLSTDKAVNPTSIMGVTKKVGELILGTLNNRQTEMISVRLCNVLDSRGSVVPCFEQQIKSGTDLAVTHHEATRFFINLESAVNLLLESVWLAEGGDVLVPEDRNPVKIMSIAEFLITRPSVKRDSALNIVCTGLRSGEKLHEELISKTEEARSVQTSGTRRFSAETISRRDLSRLISTIKVSLAQRDVGRVIEVLQTLIPEYRPSEVLSGMIYNPIRRRQAGS